MIRRPANLFFASLGTLLALLIAAPLGAQPAPAVVRVTDPADLVAMGFGPGAIVYRAVGSGGADTPDEFGTTVSGYSAYMADQFHGRASDYAYSCTDCSGAVYYTGGDNFAHAQLEMPSGANFSGVRWWGFDDHAEDLKLFVLKTCLPPFGAGPQVGTVLQSASSAGTPGNVSGFISIPGVETVDNEACTYWVSIRWDASSSFLQLYKVRAQWERQVSPAPAVATFNDVPANHPFFQFVEALSASGITAGCNAAPPLYCPDAPLTRGQMAVFLAKGFGLQWP